MESKTKTFCLGQIVATPNALDRLDPQDVHHALARHASCDWGDCSKEDADENEFALDRRLRLFSSYRDRNNTKFWIITEADRSSTTLLLPEDY